MIERFKKSFSSEVEVINLNNLDFRTRIRNTIMMLLTKMPAFKKEFINRIKTEMIKPHQKIFED